MRLHGMPTNDALRSNDNGNAERLWQGILHTAEVSRRLLGARHTPPKIESGRISERVLTVRRRAAIAMVRERVSVCAYRFEITPPKH
jgi:hypothetical protein